MVVALRAIGLPHEPFRIEHITRIEVNPDDSGVRRWSGLDVARVRREAMPGAQIFIGLVDGTGETLEWVALRSPVELLGALHLALDTDVRRANDAERIVHAMQAFVLENTQQHGGFADAVAEMRSILRMA